MNPFTYIEGAAASIAQDPTMAVAIALIGGLLSTST